MEIKFIVTIHVILSRIMNGWMRVDNVKRLKSENCVKTRRDVGPFEAGMKSVNFLI